MARVRQIVFFFFILKSNVTDKPLAGAVARKSVFIRLLYAYSFHQATANEYEQ